MPWTVIKLGAWLLLVGELECELILIFHASGVEFVKARMESGGLVEQLADGNGAFGGMVSPFGNGLRDGFIQGKKVVLCCFKGGDAPEVFGDAEEEVWGGGVPIAGLFFLVEEAVALFDEEDIALALASVCGGFCEVV